MAFASFPEGVDTGDARNGSLLNFAAVGPGYFSAAGIPLLRGRDINEHDDSQTDHVVVINRALADYLWKGQDPIGKRLSFASQPWKAEVVGVVETVKAHTLGESPQPLMYFSLKQVYFPVAILNVHTKGDADAALPSVRATVQSIDPTLNVTRIFTVSWLIEQMLVRPRFAAELLVGFGGLPCCLINRNLWSDGIFGSTKNAGDWDTSGAWSAARRCYAPDSKRWNGDGSGGVTVGLCLTAIFTRSISTLLYGIGNFDVISFVAAAVVLIAVALLACWLPARRAMRVDPMIALRYE